MHDHHYDQMMILHHLKIFVVNDIYAKYFEEVLLSKQSQQQINKLVNVFDMDNHLNDQHLKK
jgi:hypothetical protein